MLIVLATGSVVEPRDDSSQAPTLSPAISASFHAALFHWVDSLAGTAGGRTIEAHRQDYARRFGAPSSRDNELLRRFRKARIHDANRRQPDGDGGSRARGSSALPRAFFEADNLAAALETARLEMEEPDFTALREALLHFSMRYHAVWDGGRILRGFASSCSESPRRDVLDRLLARAAAFYGVDPTSGPPPTIVAVPVPAGRGTNATAVDRFLLLEIRPGDDLAEQAAVIVHESAHYLYSRMAPEQRARLKKMADESAAEEAWTTLSEALPTALGQGIADERFRPEAWSPDEPWYPVETVDRYAKALLPLVKETLEHRGRFDEAFLEKALALYPSS